MENIIKAGNNMKTTTIGGLTWMAQNLNVDCFRNGDPIPEAGTWEEWLNVSQNGLPAWCYYENDTAKGEKYGKQYNWFAVNDARGLAPSGFHIPSAEELETLRSAVNYDGNLLKCIGQGKGNGAGRSVTGFNALLGGYRDGGNNFGELGMKAYFWSSTKKINGVCYLNLTGDNKGIGISYEAESYAFSVRCVKDI